jgi:1-acyl-sn-glycerol-3-phosphate acyltransferase
MVAPSISAPVLGFFRRIVRRYFRRHFHGVRVCGLSRFKDHGGALIVYANHASWWDPMVSILLAWKAMPERSHYAPMDAEALARYGILRKVGIFPVEMKTARGALQFVRAGIAVLERGGVLWVVPQGRFVDPRARPLEFKPGLALLASKAAAALGGCTLLPLAVEYPFWDERLPEALLRFGKPVRVVAGETAEEVQARLVEALDATMDELRELAIARDPGAFATLLKGSAGAGGLYALGKRLKATILRQPYRAEHGAPGADESVPMGRAGQE